MSAPGVSETSRSTERTLDAWPRSLLWVSLIVLSALISAAWGALGLPAGLLLGPTIGGIIFGVNGAKLAMPNTANLGAQAAIGAMVAAAITPAILITFGHQYLLFCVVVFGTLMSAACIGWLISRTGLIPGATAVYGTSPGAAGPMVLLAEAEGADPRLVAFMQYSRVLLVAVAAALVARFWVHTDSAQAPGAPWFGAVPWINLAVVLALALLGQQFARLIRLQAWALLGPMVLLSALHAAGWLTIDLPRWLLAAAYAVIGWRIGLSFTREALIHAGRAMPVVIGAALCLMGLCGALAWCLTRFAHTDALTAYLATSPGGLDSVAIIAASTPHVDLEFVLALQAVRLVFVICLSPIVTRFVVRYSSHLRAARN
jgi:membrane AbrB-like protein